MGVRAIRQKAEGVRRPLAGGRLAGGLTKLFIDGAVVS